MGDPSQLDFEAEIKSASELPNVSQKLIAEWTGVDPSTVTRWLQGTKPSDPVEILKKLIPHVERAREALASVRKTEVDSWASLIGDLDPGIRDYVQRTGLFAATYYVVCAAIPPPKGEDVRELNVVFVRWFAHCWSWMGRRTYNLGDQAQIVSLSDDDPPTFGQAEGIGEIVGVDIAIDREVGRSAARIHARLNLERFDYRHNSIGFIDSFGYRYLATKAIVSRRFYPKQTNDFLGATIVIPCRRMNLLVCVPKSCVRGSPSGLSSSNRSMLKVLIELDNTDPDVIESFLWPRGLPYELSSAADAPLRRLSQVDSYIDNLPHGLQEALKRPADLTQPLPTVRDVLSSPDSVCFLLDVHEPHPSLTHSIVWRLP